MQGRQKAARHLLFALRLGTAGLGVVVCSPPAAPAAAVQQNTFATPAAAVAALVAANRAGDLRALLAILGPDAAALISSGDPIADARGRAHFVAAFDQAHKLERAGRAKMILIVGRDRWPMPIPLVRVRSAWRFDTAAGAAAILDRRVGRDELAVIEIFRAYVTAQREYAALRAKAGATTEYAEHLMSTPGQQNGLYWPVKPGQEESPLGPLIADARAEGYAPGAQTHPQPYYGYYFRILTRQGTYAPGGAKNYVIDSHMTNGFALLAYPATYGDSGIMTFTVNQDGIVYQTNFGAATTRIAPQITEYDPDPRWQPSRP
ncbi:MAG TPA: DUF2950 domain-containing protein [Stellaceae bacterium]|nr:DUF2950 domain-containing protein [Stellaceae bacterium]